MCIRDRISADWSDSVKKANPGIINDFKMTVINGVAYGTLAPFNRDSLLFNVLHLLHGQLAGKALLQRPLVLGTFGDDALLIIGNDDHALLPGEGTEPVSYTHLTSSHSSATSAK